MSIILLVTWDGSGTFIPQRALVRALVERGHQLTVLGHDTQRDDCNADGAHFISYQRLPQWNDADPANANRSIREVVEAQAGGIDALEALSMIKPDVVLVDLFMRHVLTAVHLASVRMIALGSTTFTSIYDESLLSVLELADQILMFSHPIFEDRLPAFDKYTYVGQLRPHTFYSKCSHNWKTSRKRIVVSLSTSFQDQCRMLQRICDVLGTLDVEVLVTSGRAISPSILAVSGNIVVDRCASHDIVLKTCDLLVTHAGHGTLLAGALYGTPMVCIPMGRDQHTNASRAFYLGIAQVSAPAATHAELRQTIVDALEDTYMLNRVRNVSVLLNSRAGLDDAISVVESESRAARLLTM